MYQLYPDLEGRDAVQEKPEGHAQAMLVFVRIYSTSLRHENFRPDSFLIRLLWSSWGLCQRLCFGIC